MDFFRQSGDSLAGRYFLFHLYPLTLMECVAKKGFGAIPNDAITILDRCLHSKKTNPDLLTQLLIFSGFPEPFLSQRSSFFIRWKRGYIDRLVQEDLRDLTRIQNRENVANLVFLLPQRIGAPLSLNALSRDVMVNHATIRHYIQALRLTYIIFQIAPYSKKVARAVTKEKKVYFFDWTRAASPGAVFENLVAVHLQSWIDYFNDAGKSDLQLYFVRTKDGQETDFLIVKDTHPWLLIECKLSKSPIESHHRRTQKALGNIPIVQLIQESGCRRKEGVNVYQISADIFFSELVE